MQKVDAFLELLADKTIRRLLVQEHWYLGELNDPVNVLFAELDDNNWVRFFFDAGVFFWATVQSPALPEQSEKHWFSLRDAGVYGRVAGAMVEESFDAALLEIHFVDGRVFQLHNQEDRSSFRQTTSPRGRNRR